MLRLLSIFLNIGISWCAFAAIESIDALEKQNAKIYLQVGSESSLQFKTNLIRIESSEILHAENRNGKIIIRGLKEGQTRLFTENKEFDVQVLSNRSLETKKLLEEIVHHQIGMRVEVRDGQIVLAGRLHSIEDLHVIQNQCARSRCYFHLQAQISPSVKSELEREINLKLEKKKIPRQVLETDHEIYISIQKGSKLLPVIHSVVDSYGIRIVETEYRIEDSPMMRIELRLAEVNRQELLRAGIHWHDSYSFDQLTIAKSGGQTGALAKDGLDLSLEALEENKVARILASPNILVRSGKDAQFIAGGEFPIKIISPHFRDVVWKQYGIVMKIKPLADSTGHMNLNLDIEISSLDDAHKVDNIPGLITNHVQSTFDLKESKVIALSGLIRHDQSNLSSGLPGLSQIPILGSLFASKDFQDNKTEFVIFVKPEIVQLESPL